MTRDTDNMASKHGSGSKTRKHLVAFQFEKGRVADRPAASWCYRCNTAHSHTEDCAETPSSRKPGRYAVTHKP